MSRVENESVQWETLPDRLLHHGRHVTATSISKSRQPETFGQSRSIAKEGGSVARNAREDIESRLGHSVLSESNASDKKALEIKTDSTNSATEETIPGIDG